jgi:hypothetical protein
MKMAEEEHAHAWFDDTPETMAARIIEMNGGGDEKLRKQLVHDLTDTGKLNPLADTFQRIRCTCGLESWRAIDNKPFQLLSQIFIEHKRRTMALQDKTGRAAAGKPKLALDGPDVCACMHTALRKCCDSPITSAAYNLIYLIDLPEFDPWQFYGGLVAELLGAGEKPVEAAVGAARTLEDKYMSFVREKGGNPRRQALLALSCTFECFNEKDWEGFAAFLAE